MRANPPENFREDTQWCNVIFFFSCNTLVVLWIIPLKHREDFWQNQSDEIWRVRKSLPLFCYFRWMLSRALLVCRKFPYHLCIVCFGLVGKTILNFKFVLEEAKLDNPYQVVINAWQLWEQSPKQLAFEQLWAGTRWGSSVSGTRQTLLQSKIL